MVLARSPFNFISESPVREEIATTTNRYQDFSKNLNNRIDNLKLTNDYMQVLNDGRDLINWADRTDVKLDQTKPTSSEPDTLAKEIEAFKVRKASLLTFAHVME